MHKKVLLVENDIAHFDAFESILQDLGYYVIRKDGILPITSYNEALEAYNLHKPISLMLLDIELDGDKNGVDFAKFILINKIPTNIVFTTEHTQVEAANKFETLGSGFITIKKPGGKIDPAISLYDLTIATNPNYNSLKLNIEQIFIDIKKVFLNQDVNKQLDENRKKSDPHVLQRQNILFISTCYNFSEVDVNLNKNNCIIYTKSLDHAFVIHKSLDELQASIFHHNTFIRVNKQTIINIENDNGKIKSENSKYLIDVCGYVIEVSNTFKRMYEATKKEY